MLRRGMLVLSMVAARTVQGQSSSAGDSNNNSILVSVPWPILVFLGVVLLVIIGAFVFWCCGFMKSGGSQIQASSHQNQNMRFSYVDPTNSHGQSYPYSGDHHVTTSCQY